MIVEFRVLGPVETGSSGSAQPSPKQRELLAFLLVRAGEVLTADRIAEELWGESAGDVNPKTIQFHLSKLRDALEPDRPRGDTGTIIRTSNNGYVLDLESHWLDSRQFESLVRDARRVATSDPQAASRTLREAVSMWRGRALEGLDHLPFAQVEAKRLDELRVHAIDLRIRADLACGQHAELVSELESLTKQHPLREGLRASLMLALYRSGRRAESLRSYRDTHQTFADELGLEPSTDLRQLEQLIVQQDRSLALDRTDRAARTGNVPVERTSLLGRELELSDLTDLVKSTSMVTLTGAGGVGKTSLALAAARRLDGSFQDGIWLVELADVRDGREVVQHVASTLDIAGEPGESLSTTLVSTLAERQLLLILDNCEHLLDGAARLADELVSRSARVTVLATSREPLSVVGERVFPVACLDVAGTSSSAAQLFSERALEIGWKPTREDEAAISVLCERLDGLPLAIELAAARARSMNLTTMVDRLDDRFRVLTTRHRRDPRQGSMRAAVDWSYRLLTPPEQELFDRLSVFVGGFDLPAIEHAATELGLDAFDADDVFAALVDKSMVASNGGRFFQLETLRQYGAEQLEIAGRTNAGRNANLAWYAQFVVEAHCGLKTRDQTEWWSRVSADWANIRAAFKWAVEVGDAESALSITSHLGLWASLQQRHEVYDWATEAIRMQEAGSCSLYPTCVGVASMGAEARGDLDMARTLARRADTARTSNSNDLDQLIDMALSTLDIWDRETDLAVTRLQRQIDAAARIGDQMTQATWLSMKSWTLSLDDRHQRALISAAEARDLANRTGNPSAVSIALFAEGFAIGTSDRNRGIRLLNESIEIADAASARWVSNAAGRALSSALSGLGDHGLALDHIMTSLIAKRDEGAWTLVWNYLIYAAVALDGLGHQRTAATLVGAIETSVAPGGRRSERRMVSLRGGLVEVLGQEAVDKLAEEGRRLSVQEAVALTEEVADQVVSSR